MQIIDSMTQTQDTPNQRWGNTIAIGFCIVSIFIGVALRNTYLFATQVYSNSTAGIFAEYPTGWLLDESGDKVFMVQDIARQGFKTSINVTIYPFTDDMTPRNVLDNLSFERSQILASYNLLRVEEIQLPNDQTAILSEYTYVYTDPNPFLEAIPIVVIGQDILIQRRNQILLITFRADATTFSTTVEVFNRFLSTLDY